MHPSALYLLGLCEGKEDVALAYIIGWTDRQQHDADSGDICFPNGMRPQWARDILCEYMTAHAKNLTLNMDADKAMWSAMHETWPCNK
ncbi:Rap1a/Tai family immunity protein [Rhizobium leguminosarum]|nr:Rap1a/Tai family immunity protein [Rhizobium leguminosarum]